MDATSRTGRPTSRPATSCSAPTTRSGRGVAATPRSPTATRCCRCPTREYEPLAFPDRRGDPDTDGTPIRMAFGRKASSLQRGLAEGGGADAGTTAPRRRSISSQVRLLPHGAAPVRPPGRRDAGGASVLRQPLEHLAGDDPEGRGRRTPLVGETASPFASLGQRKTRTITYYMNPEFPDDQPLRKMAPPDGRRLEPGDEGDRRRRSA